MNTNLKFDDIPVVISQMFEKVNRLENFLTRQIEPPKPQRFDFNGALAYLNDLGYTISKSKLQKVCADAKIPCRKFNNRLVFERSELDSWAESHTVAVGNNSDAALNLAASANRKLRR